MRTLHARRPEGRGGFTLLELVFSIVIYVVILMASLAMLERDTHLSRATLGVTHVEMMAQELLHRLKTELASARGLNPEAIVTAALGTANGVDLQVDSTLGFPNRGWLLLDRGTVKEERVRYEGLADDEVTFKDLARGQQCSEPSAHQVGGELVWAGLAEPIAEQDAPTAEMYDGLALGVLGPVYFRGDGTGFSYRKPVDPDGGTDYLDGDEITWGAQLGDLSSLDGYSCLEFQPRSEYEEALTGHDINGDGDRLDVFDVGVIGRRRWITGDAAGPTEEFNMGPAAVLQERCNWGGDLDGDGFDDPIFLWDKETRQLHMRLFVVGGLNQGSPIVRQVESVVFLRNEVEI